MATENVTSLGKVVKNVGRGIWDKTFGRLTSSGVSRDSRIVHSVAKWSGRHDKRDWRVKLTIPEGSPIKDVLLSSSNNLLKPLANDNGFFFPLTPTMVIQHSANYNALAQTHNNYPFQAYQNSQVDQMNIIGEFPVQNQQDAAYWVATVNFLRTITKMFFGAEQDFKGNPPPIMHLSGYGDHMFQKVPVIVNTFNVELRSGIDYISTRQDAPPQFKTMKPTSQLAQEQNPDTIDQTWAPTLSNISVLLTPTYSRESIQNFNLRDFAEGKLRGEDRIGFI